MGLGLYMILPLPILYGVRRTQGGSGGGCILRISRAKVAIVWAMQMEGAIKE